MAKYRKTITAVVGAVIASIPLVWDMKIEQGEAITLVTVWATAFGVYQVANTGVLNVERDRRGRFAPKDKD